jgi:hypothetical protein
MHSLAFVSVFVQTMLVFCLIGLLSSVSAIGTSIGNNEAKVNDSIATPLEWCKYLKETEEPNLLLYNQKK